MDNEFEPTTDSGAGDPPSGTPPHATAAGESPDDDPPQRPVALIRGRSKPSIAEWVSRTLDLVDIAADKTRDAMLRSTKV